jgi:hypothetical protein
MLHRTSILFPVAIKGRFCTGIVERLAGRHSFFYFYSQYSMIASGKKKHFTSNLVLNCSILIKYYSVVYSFALHSDVFPPCPVIIYGPNPMF